MAHDRDWQARRRVVRYHDDTLAIVHAVVLPWGDTDPRRFLRSADLDQRGHHWYQHSDFGGHGLYRCAACGAMSVERNGGVCPKRKGYGMRLVFQVVEGTGERHQGYLVVYDGGNQGVAALPDETIRSIRLVAPLVVSEAGHREVIATMQARADRATRQAADLMAIAASAVSSDVLNEVRLASAMAEGTAEGWRLVEQAYRDHARIAPATYLLATAEE